MTTPELLPCPWCGEDAYDDEPTWRIFGKRTGHAYAIACSNCEASSPGGHTTSSAIAAWNTRAPLSPAVLAELPEVRDLAERAAKAVLDEYRDSQGQWTFRQEHIENAIAQVFAAAIREGRG